MSSSTRLRVTLESARERGQTISLATKLVVGIGVAEMAARAIHGNAARNGRIAMAIETLPADELPSATPALPVKAERDDLGRFRPGNAISKKRRCRPNVRGVPGADLASPEFRVFANWGRRYAASRREELARTHGGTLSAGAAAMIESAAMALAASRFIQHKAGQTGDVELFARATALASTARTHELAAWEIASREAKARPKAPWQPPAALSDALDGDERGDDDALDDECESASQGGLAPATAGSE